MITKNSFIIFTAMLVLSNFVQTFAHQEYYKLNTTTRKLDAFIGVSDQTIRWWEYYDNLYGAKIPLDFQGSQLGSFNPTQVEGFFRAAKNTWNATAPSGGEPFYEYTGSYTTVIEVNNFNESVYADPGYAGAVTLYAVDFIQTSIGYVASLQAHAWTAQTDDRTGQPIYYCKILVNNTSSFLSNF